MAVLLLGFRQQRGHESCPDLDNHFSHFASTLFISFPPNYSLAQDVLYDLFVCVFVGALCAAFTNISQESMVESAMLLSRYPAPSPLVNIFKNSL